MYLTPNTQNVPCVKTDLTLGLKLSTHNYKTLEFKSPLPRSFRCQRWASGQPGVDLDDAVFQRWRVQGVLDVALSHNPEVAHHFNGRLPQHVVLLVGQSLAGCHHNGVTLDRKREQGWLIGSSLQLWYETFCILWANAFKIFQIFVYGC